ncbi:MAG: BCCT family transporter, partial [Flavobacteriales bacterium]|nr:BCCT family transporter [Flavobacteriales bacterium]
MYQTQAKDEIFPCSKTLLSFAQRNAIQGNSPKQRFMKSIQPWVFFSSAALISVFVTLTILNQDTVGELFGNVQAFISEKFGWLYVGAVNIILVFVVYLGFSRFRNIRIGGERCEPEFSTFAWLSMLFNAGIGLVLMFYSVAEPVLHFSNPPYGEPGTLEAAKNALNISYLHWGFHGWTVYALMGLAIAFFAYNKGLPLGIRWILYPLLGDRLKGPIGHFIDVMAVVATMFGLATTLGLGIQHINSGMNYLFGLAQSANIQVVLIVVI